MVTVAVLLGTFLAALDITIVGTAMPTIIGRLVFRTWGLGGGRFPGFKKERSRAGPFDSGGSGDIRGRLDSLFPLPHPMDLYAVDDVDRLRLDGSDGFEQHGFADHRG
jgi:hypothetical protein